LITGGAGYIGSVLTQTLLEHGHSVRVLDRLVYGGEALIPFFNERGFQFVYGDVKSSKAVSDALVDMDYVVHLAALVGERVCGKYPDEAVKTNTDAAINLYEMSKTKAIKGFIFFSTCSNYGFDEVTIARPETAVLQPTNLYARTKVRVEQYLGEKADKRLPVIIGRLATGYGISPRMRFDLLVSEFVRDAYQKKMIEVYGPSAWRPICHIKDHAEATLLLLDLFNQEKFDLEIFNVGSDNQNYMKLEIAKMVADRLDVELKINEEKKEARSYKVAFKKIFDLGFKAEGRPQETIEQLKIGVDAGILNFLDKYDNLLGAKL
jgi:nucleoside-diphosphate-sugar epimerase